MSSFVKIRSSSDWGGEVENFGQSETRVAIFVFGLAWKRFRANPKTKMATLVSDWPKIRLQVLNILYQDWRVWFSGWLENKDGRSVCIRMAETYSTSHQNGIWPNLPGSKCSISSTSSDWQDVLAKWAIFSFFSMILKFSMGHILSFYTDLYGPFSKLMRLCRMAPCLPNHCTSKLVFSHRLKFLSTDEDENNNDNNDAGVMTIIVLWTFVTANKKAT